MTERSPWSNFEVKGQAVMAIVAAMSLIQSQALKILADRGITPLEKDRWYPVDRALEVFKIIQTEIGPTTVKAVGRKMPEVAEFPPISSIEEGFRSIDVAYRMNHRGLGNIGGYVYKSLGERKGQIVCNVPYPCALDEGILEAIGERFKPKGSLWVRVEHAPGSCRKHGGDSCTYNLSW
jgi:hypothetical protein